MSKRVLTMLVTAATCMAASDRWYEIRLNGEPTGYFHTSETAAGETTGTLQEMEMAINRLGKRVEITSRTETTEDAAGHFLKLSGQMSSSQQEIRFDAVRNGDAITLNTTAGGRSYAKEVPAQGEVLGPVGAAERSCGGLKRPGDTVSYAIFSGEFSQITTVTRTLLAAEKRGGLRVEEEMSASPGKTLSTLDSTCELVESARDLPFGRAEFRLADKATALAAAKGSEWNGEAFSQTLAHSHIRLPDARSIDRIRLRIVQRKPDMGWPPLTGPNQKVIEKTPSAAVIEVTREAAPEAQSIDEQAYLRPNAILQSDDPEVHRLAQEITAGEKDHWRAARKLQDWTAAHLKLDLGVALAPASEVVRNRRGTCIAYAVLLASLERAAGIPSRVVLGYVYVDGIWGGHAWTEVAVDGRWRALDAAVYDPGTAGAARFRFDAYTLDDTMAAANKAGLQLYSNIDVAVLEYQEHDKITFVPADAKPFTVSGQTYRNPWLGFAVEAPAGFRFGKLDAVYPDSTVLEIAGESGKVTMEQALEWSGGERADGELLREIAPEPPGTVKIDGRPALVVSSQQRARLVAADGKSWWVLTAEGPHAAELLNQVSGSWKWLSHN